MALYSRKTLSVYSNGARYCYDRIVHSVNASNVVNENDSSSNKIDADDYAKDKVCDWKSL